MKNPIIVFFVVFFLAMSCIVSAGEKNEIPIFRFGAENSIGGPWLLKATPIPGGETTHKVFHQFTARFSFPKNAAVELEFSAMSYPAGFGIGLRFNLIKIKYFTIHLIDPGVVFWPTKNQLVVNRPEAERSFDITLGLGGEVELTDWLSAGIGWKWFIPNPVQVIPYLGNFSRLVYREVSGGMLCVSITAWIFP